MAWVDAGQLAPGGLCRRAAGGLGRRPAGHAGDAVRPAPAGRGAGAVDHADLRAVLDVRLRNALAESGRGAGDDGDLAFELALNHGDNSFVC